MCPAGTVWRDGRAAGARLALLCVLSRTESNRFLKGPFSTVPWAGALRRATLSGALGCTLACATALFVALVSSGDEAKVPWWAVLVGVGGGVVLSVVADSKCWSSKKDREPEADDGAPAASGERPSGETTG